MEKNLFEKIDPLVDDIAEQISELIEEETLSQLKQKLADLSRELGGYSLTLEMNVEVFDPERERSLPLLQMGLASSDGEPPYPTWADSSPHRYIVNGEMIIVPHDHCPRCWGVWDFKSRHPTCESCGATMGRDVKLLLDSDRCPQCEKGTLTAHRPECTACGFSVNPAHVVWG